MKSDDLNHKPLTRSLFEKSNDADTTDPSPEEPRRPNPTSTLLMTSSTSFETTCLRSCTSDLRQALDALRDLVEVIPPSTDPLTVSARQQAKTVLKRHEKPTKHWS